MEDISDETCEGQLFSQKPQINYLRKSFVSICFE